jgi:intracellular sulfur oxidation DsrE/DsrF family protein
MDSTGSSRRAFIASTASAAASAAIGGPVPTTMSIAHRTPHGSAAIPFRFDRSAFEAILERPFPHRQLAAPSSFDAATVAMSHFLNSLAAYADPAGFAAGPNGLHCAAILYAGRSYAMVLDDYIYETYHVGAFADEEMRPNDLTHRAYWTALKKSPMADFLKPLVDQGVSFFVCNNALSGFAFELAQKAATDGAPVKHESVVAIHDELAAHFLPGTMLVPAGVAAVNAAQEARFTFLP